LAIFAAVVTILGTFVFALFGDTGLVGSGLGFIENLDQLFSNAESNANALKINVALYWFIVSLFFIFLVSGALQFIGVKSRVFLFIISLFPLGVGIMITLVFYTDALGDISTLFTLFMVGEQYGDIFPLLIKVGDVAFGTFLLLGGGVLGIISAILPREEYY
jgi:hypothetical protein